MLIFHEQFLTKTNQHLRFLAGEHEPNKLNSKKLMTIQFLHTSSKDGGFENRIRIHLSRFIVTLQLEALLSIMKFQDNIMQKWPKDNLAEEAKSEFFAIESLSGTTRFEMEADLEEFRVIIATIDTQMFDIFVQGLIFFGFVVEFLFIKVSKLMYIRHLMKPLSI